MKKLLLILIILTGISFYSFSQVPQGFNYQAVVRNSLGAVIENQNVSIKIDILQSSSSGTSVYSEEHSATTNQFGLVNLEIGGGTVLSGDFATINWGEDIYFLRIEVDVTGGTNYQLMGVSQLLTVPYAMYAQNSADSSLWELNGSNIYYDAGNVGVGTITPNGRLQVNSDTTAGINDVIFSVLNANGDTVLAVYQEGVRIWVSDDTTGAKANGSRGGFAVGGFNPTKSNTEVEYLRVTPDSVRIYIEEGSSGTKANGSRGGFAVGGYSPTKAMNMTDYYMNVEYNNDPEIIDPAKPRMLWYPYREAFRAGKVLIEHADSVGINSFASGFESKAIGDWSQSFGYNTIARGDYSTAIGKNSIAIGESSFAFGNGAISSELECYSFGSGSIAEGIGSYSFGSQGVDTTTGLPNSIVTRASGMYSFALGQGSLANGKGSFTFGMNNSANGDYSFSLGYYSFANGNYSFSYGIGAQSAGLYSYSIGTGTSSIGKHSMALGSYTIADGENSTALGFFTHSTGHTATAFGYYTDAIGDFSLSGGSQSVASGGHSIAIGNSVTASGIGAIALGFSNISSGTVSIALGSSCSATADNSISIGYLNEATALFSASFGFLNQSTGDYSIAFGNGNKCSGYSSKALGSNTLSTGSYSNSFGFGTIAEGSYSSSFGYYTIAKPFLSFVVGRYNDTLCYGGGYWEDLDPLFIIGNGTSNSFRSNAMWVRKDGEVYFPFVFSDAVGATNLDLYIDNTGKIGYLSSAKRYKKKITNIENIDWLYKLRPVNYIYKNDESSIKQYGLIAEEVEKVNPLFVSYNNNGDIETVQYSKLISPMIKAIQDIKNENEELKIKVKEIEDLRTKIQELENLINLSVKR